MNWLRGLAFALALTVVASVLFAEIKPEWLETGIDAVPFLSKWFYSHFK